MLQWSYCSTGCVNELLSCQHFILTVDMPVVCKQKTRNVSKTTVELHVQLKESKTDPDCACHAKKSLRGGV